MIAHSPAIIRRAALIHGIPWAAGDRPQFNAIMACSCPTCSSRCAVEIRCRSRPLIYFFRGGLSTCSLVTILLAFASSSRSSAPPYLRVEPQQHTCMRTARAARACMCCSQPSLLLVDVGQPKVVCNDARNSCGPIQARALLLSLLMFD